MSAKTTAERFYRSAGAAAFSQLWRVGVTFGVDLLLRRWIPAADHGLWDWSLTAFLVLGAVRDLGLVYHVVRDDERPYGSLLRLELVWGGALVVITWFAAPLLAAGFQEARPDVVPVLRAMTLFLFFEGLASVPRTFFESELEIGRAVQPEILRNLAMAATALTMAKLGYGIWSLVVAQIVAAGLYALLLWRRAAGRIVLARASRGTLSLVAQSWPLAMIWFLVILVDRIDVVVVGRLHDADTLGNYSYAYSRAFLASTILTPAVTRTLYPALVAFRRFPRQLFEAYRLATVLLVSIQAPIAWFLFVNPATTIRLLGGPQWEAAPRYLAILCFAPLIEPIGRLGGEVLKTLRADRLWIASSALTLTTFAAGGWWATTAFGPVGMAWINYLPVGALLIGWWLHRLAPDGFRRLLGDIALTYLGPALVFLPVRLLIGEPWTRFGVSLIALTIVLAVEWRRHGRHFKAFVRDPVAATETPTPRARPS